MFWKYFFIIYAILCFYVSILKPPFIWRTKKFEVMTKIFKSTLAVQVFVLIFGIITLCIGLFIF